MSVAREQFHFGYPSYVVYDEHKKFTFTIINTSPSGQCFKKQWLSDTVERETRNKQSNTGKMQTKTTLTERKETNIVAQVADSRL